MKPAARFALGLVACASAACAGPLAGEAAPRQVIVGFVAPTDTAAPATLARLAEIGGAKVAFVAAISASSAAYRLDCPPPTPPASGPSPPSGPTRPSATWKPTD